MGWTNSHLHHFMKDRTFYTPDAEDENPFGGTNSVYYKKVKVCDLLVKAKDKMIYEYDFGDGWIHDVILEKILPLDNSIKYPICTDGNMSCPPEDCGGMWGYYRNLEILKVPDHDEYEETIERFGEDFDPEFFDIDEVNASL